MVQIRSGNLVKKLSLLGAPVICILFMLLVDLSPGKPEVTYTAGIALWMAMWWITEAIPLPATALIPLVFFPLFGVMDGKAVSNQYVNYIIFLFIGGFLVALAMEKWHLHKRLALRILMFTGVHPRSILLGFMAACAFLSMWISNTATTMMMVPIAMAITGKLDELLGPEKVRKFSVGIFLGIAYSASIGGVATLIGTPPNPIFVRIFNIFFPRAPEISFAQWFFFALPLSLLFLFIAWWLLCLFFIPRHDISLDKHIFSAQYRELGPISFEEKIVLVDFILLVLFWMLRADIAIGGFKIPGWAGLLPKAAYVNDGTVSIAMAFLLFLIPSKNRPGSRIIDWKTARGLPWGIVLLFGGGFALAGAFKNSGLSAWLGEQMKGLSALPPVLIIACICLTITFLTELTSNTATSQILLPVLATLAVSMKINPLLLMIPGTISCSFAFMLPVATPPNAIVFGTEKVGIADMARMGIILNLIGVVLITLLVFILGKLVFGIDLTQPPAWLT